MAALDKTQTNIEYEVQQSKFNNIKYGLFECAHNQFLGKLDRAVNLVKATLILQAKRYQDIADMTKLQKNVYIIL